MDKNNSNSGHKGYISPKTQEQQQAKKEKLARALRENLRRRKIPAQVEGEEK
jgi:hypothetical protein